MPGLLVAAIATAALLDHQPPPVHVADDVDQRRPALREIPTLGQSARGV
jgi:hypothetical protein